MKVICTRCGQQETLDRVWRIGCNGCPGTNVVEIPPAGNRQGELPIYKEG